MPTLARSSKMKKRDLLAFICLFVIVAGIFVYSTRAAGGVFYISPTGNDSANCTVSAPCQSISRAYTVAAAGDVIEVAAGTYGRQVISSGTKAVTIQPANGAIVIFGTTSIQASNITMKGITIQRNDDPGLAATLEAGGSNLTFDGVNVDTKRIDGRQGLYANGSNNTFKNGSSHDVQDEKAALISGTNNTFDNFDFYNAIFQTDGVHMECAYVIGADGLVIKNSKFWNCAVMDVFVTRGSWYNAPKYGNLTFENNVFSHPTLGSGWHYYGLAFGDALAYDAASTDGIKVRYNTFENDVLVDPSITWGGASEWVGNVGGGWPCKSGMNFRYNVGTKCSTSDKAVSPASSTQTTVSGQKWANPSTLDFHLTATSPAIDAGDPTSYPAKDKDGKTRYIGAAPDAGAFEYGTGGSTPPQSLKGDIDGDQKVDGTDLSILLTNYGKSTAQLSDPDADIDANGTVDIFDLSALLSNYGKVTSSTPINQTLGFNTLNAAASDDFTGNAGTKPSNSKWGAKTFTATNGSVVYWNGLNNVQLDGAGNLDIYAMRQASGTWNSSWISGTQSYSGPRYVEARAKVAGGQGPWSAPIWEWDAPYGSLGTENDVIEQLGIEPLSYHTTLHSGGTDIGKNNATTSTLANDYHVYGAAIYVDKVDYYLDGVKIPLIPKTEIGNKWGFNTTPMVPNINL